MDACSLNKMVVASPVLSNIQVSLKHSSARKCERNVKCEISHLFELEQTYKKKNRCA